MLVSLLDCIRNEDLLKQKPRLASRSSSGHLGRPLQFAEPTTAGNKGSRKDTTKHKVRRLPPDGPMIFEGFGKSVDEEDSKPFVVAFVTSG